MADDYCANCGKPLRPGPMGSRYACETWHGGNTGFYLTTAGPPTDGHAVVSVGKLHIYGSKKDRVRAPGGYYPQRYLVRRLLGLRDRG